MNWKKKTLEIEDSSRVVRIRKATCQTSLVVKKDFRSATVESGSPQIAAVSNSSPPPKNSRAERQSAERLNRLFAQNSSAGRAGIDMVKYPVLPYMER